MSSVLLERIIRSTFESRVDVEVTFSSMLSLAVTLSLDTERLHNSSIALGGSDASGSYIL